MCEELGEWTSEGTRTGHEVIGGSLSSWWSDVNGRRVVAYLAYLLTSPPFTLQVWIEKQTVARHGSGFVSDPLQAPRWSIRIRCESIDVLAYGAG